jgi:hypothetical protein
MIYGIVGHEAAKFTPETEEKAREAIRSILKPGDRVCSGACPLGGIDVWAIEEAKKLGLKTREFPPKVNSWEEGFKPRNIQIAETADEVINIVVTELPETYKGRRFDYCYHCHTDTHIKSGGCWTAKHAAELGKPIRIIEI